MFFHGKREKLFITNQEIGLYSGINDANTFFTNRETCGVKGKEINSVKRTAVIIETLSYYGPIGVREIARLINNDKSTVHRTISTLEETGFVIKSAVNGKYLLSPKLFEIANRSLAINEVTARIESHLRELNKITKETILTAVLFQENILYIHKTNTHRQNQVVGEVEVTAEIGYRLPLYSTAGGKVILAFLDPFQRVHIINKITPLKKTAKNTKLSKAVLLKELDEIACKGYAISDEEYQNGYSAIAAPLFTYGKKVIGSVAIVAPASKMRENRFSELGIIIVKYGKLMSAELGCED